MKICIFLIALFLSYAVTTDAAKRTVTYFADGTIVEHEASGNKGVVEALLPSGFKADSLQVVPLANSVIKRVDVRPVDKNSKPEKELDQLLEQKNRLEDRIKALDVREEIFVAAAKSQSGKAPRKTKANPDPMQSIRQGTDFAIAQLESVYTIRRKTVKEIKQLDTKIAALKKNSGNFEQKLRVEISPANGKLKILFANSGTGWKPAYDIRLDTLHEATVVLNVSKPDAGASNGRAAMALVADYNRSVKTVPILQGEYSKLFEYKMTTSEEQFGEGLTGSFSFLLKNSSNNYLPAGKASIYRNGIYWGEIRFDGLSAGKSLLLQKNSI